MESTISSNAPRIMIVDNDPSVGEFLQSTLPRAGYIVHIVGGTGQDLIGNAEIEAQTFRPHIAIVDLRLSDEEDRYDEGGLKLLGKLYSAKKILYSTVYFWAL